MVQVPPLFTPSVRLVMGISIQPLGLVTVILPFTAQSLSVNPVSATTTVYLKITLPLTCRTSVLLTSFEILQLYVRSKVAVAVLVMVRSAGQVTVIVAVEVLLAVLAAFSLVAV